MGKLISATSAGEAAAIWWQKTLSSRITHNRTLNAPGIQFAQKVADNSPTNLHSPSALKQFATILKESVSKELQRGPVYPIELSVDYLPQGLLGKCAQRAKLSDRVTDWPWHTVMRVTATSVNVNGKLVWKR